MNLLDSILGGDRRSISRVLTQVENQDPNVVETLSQLYASTGQAHLVGITGAPGTGKSTLVNQLAVHLRKLTIQKSTPKIAIIAVDPSSPFSEGALLGDRVRMRDLHGDPGIFIRSVATRGSLGGLSTAVAAMTQVFDAAGYDLILIETVGVGQAEVEIARLAHTTIVVEAPGLGDDIQALKAGLLEVADILVVNKADKPEAARTERALRGVLGISDLNDQSWLPPLCTTNSLTGEGVPELIQHIFSHREFLEQSGQMQIKESDRIENEISQLIHTALYNRWYNTVAQEKYQNLLDQVTSRKLSVYEAVEKLVGENLK